MNILDILIAKRKSFTGETESLVRRANEAMAAANTVASKVNEAEDLLSAAQTANETAQSAAAILEELQTNITNAAAEVVDDRIDLALQNLNIDNAVTNASVTADNAGIYKGKHLSITKKDITSNYEVEKNYTTTGQNEDGAMTQKAITDALNNQKTFLETKINNIPSSGSSTTIGDFTDALPGSLIIVDENGHVISSSITEDDIVQTQMVIGTYVPKSALGIEIDYDNKTVIRILEAANLTAGSDFDQYPMYGGRKRCIVKDDGEIVAFYGDSNYIEDGSLGQVMVYQPKFYYLRTPLKVTRTGERTLINKENIYISAIRQSGFSIHPVFLDENDNELDYILLPAYESCTFDTSANIYNIDDTQTVNFNEDLLCSIANAKPTSGIMQSFNVTNAEILAQNRGSRWHLTNLAAEAMNQMLMIIEFGSLNIQNTFNKGITQLTDYNNLNISCLTGATSSLGNTSGMASSTTQVYGNTTKTYTTEGTCAFSYRGVENSYGNMWGFIGDVKIITNNGTQYLTYKDNKGTTKTFASAIPANDSWISYFGYDQNALWAFIPTQCQGANSAVPVGDYTYVDSQSNTDKCCVIGGKASARDYAGPFYYGMDYDFDTAAQSYNGRLMYKPVYNSDIYLMNIIKWSEGGE